MIPVICINDSNIPKDFKDKTKWVKKDKEYHIIRVLFISNSNTLGVELNEIDLSNCNPYLYFKIDRFAIPLDKMENFINLVKACKEELELDVDINKLLEELTLNTV